MKTWQEIDNQVINYCHLSYVMVRFNLKTIYTFSSLFICHYKEILNTTLYVFNQKDCTLCFMAVQSGKHPHGYHLKSSKKARMTCYYNLMHGCLLHTVYKCYGVQWKTTWHNVHRVPLIRQNGTWCFPRHDASHL